MSSQDVIEYRRRRKKLLIKICGDKCNLCGYSRSISALEFHHIDPSLKEYGIAKNGTCHNLQKDLQEVKKTILVCANCHREIHEELYSQEELYNKQIFNEELAKEALENKAPVKYYCSVCGKELSGKTQTGKCEDCYHKSLKKVERPSRNELKSLIRQKSFLQIGKEYGVTDNAIRKWCDKYGLPRKKTEIIKLSDEEWAKI